MISYYGIGIFILNTVIVFSENDGTEMICKNNSLSLSQYCRIECHEEVKAFFYTFSHNEVEVCCKFPDSWVDFSKIKVNFTTSTVNVTDVTMSGLNFSQSISLHNVTDSLGLYKIDTLKLIKPNFLGALKTTYNDKNLKNLQINGAKTKSDLLEFFEVPNLNVLKISDCSLDKLKFKDLKKYKNLFALNVSNNMISEIKPKAFSNLIKLRVLDVSLNKLSFLPERIFENLKGLKQINLESNELSALPVHIFLKNKNLSEINLKNNLLENLPDGIFRNLKELTFVDLSDNQIFELPASLFQESRALQFLNLQRNALKEIPPRLFDSTALTSLRLGSNRLKNLNQ